MFTSIRDDLQSPLLISDAILNQLQLFMNTSVIPAESTVRNLSVERVTPMKSTKDGSIIGYKHKLQTKAQTATPFGPTMGKQETYYISLAAPCELGFTAELDLANFNIVEEAYTVPAGEPNAGTEMQLKTLYAK